MSEPGPKQFDEALISAYLDDELTQQESQRVRLHLEDCAESRAIFEELKQIREASMDTRFESIPDDQWDERPRGSLSRVFVWVGLAVLLVTIVTAIIVDIVDPGELETLLKIGFYGGGLLVFLSVLIDRLKTYKTDRYRGVEK